MLRENPANIDIKAALRLQGMRLLLALVLMGLSGAAAGQEQYEVKHGTVRFHSEEPNEYISAFSNSLTGNINVKTGSFHFRIAIGSFKGFNCPLLRLHFNTNSMETGAYPEASFSGVLLDKVDFSRDGEYNVRAKGKMRIHGVEQYRIVRVHITAKDGMISLDAKLPVVLEEHNIRTPKLTMKRIATEVMVDVTANLVASVR